MIKTILSGFGGQGVLFMGYAMATTAMKEGYHTTYLPSYGAEVRGGTANCTVAVSDEEIASPVASEPDFVMVLNNPSMLRFQSHLMSDGTLFVNSDMVDIEPVRGDITLVKTPGLSIATELENPKGMNVVMLGAFLKHTKLFEYETMEAVISEIFSKRNEKAIEPNLKCLQAGYDCTD